MHEARPRQIESYVTREGRDVFHDWVGSLADPRTRALIDRTVAKIRLGNLGKHKSVGGGVQEITLDHGPGYRIYFGEHGERLVILLGGSTKRRQQETIESAQRYWNDWKQRSTR